MKHRIVHTLQKYVLNPPIKLGSRWDCLYPDMRCSKQKGERREATAHSGRGWTYRKPILAGGRAWHEGGIRSQH